VAEVREQLKATGAWAGDWQNRRKDGTTFTSHIRVTTIDARGKRCRVSVQEDVTDRRRLEDELQRRVGELAVADRWCDIAVGAWSVTWNVGPGWEDLFYESYGVQPEPDRITFYRLLYDLAS
jgi:hypothetical protein